MVSYYVAIHYLQVHLILLLALNEKPK